ncbi:MAG: sugar phosphate isomerase/epimerase family protein [Bryobacteraceae bacterium]
MSNSSRREFVIRSAAVLPVTRAAFAMDKLQANNLGVQLYTVRNVITKNPAATLKAIESIGYTEVEVTYDKLSQIWSALKQTNLRRVSVHMEEAIFTEGGDPLDSALKDLKGRGFEYVVAPSLPTAKGGTAGIKRLAQILNKAGEQAKKRGLTLCYHNHAHDFQPIDGVPALETLLDETQKDLVFLEMDIFWVTEAGHDPVQVLKTHAGRVPLMHLKDRAKGIATQFNEDVPKDAFKAVGSGSIDIPAVLKAADAAGVKHYFVEQDQTPGDPIASLRQSYKYLSSLFNS